MTTEREAQLRELFEKYAEDNGLNTVKGNCGWYISPATSNAYQGFLACARALEPMVMDGERYRWLRLNSGYSIRCNLFGETPMYEHKDSDLDEAIDAAMSAALEDGNATE